MKSPRNEMIREYYINSDVRDNPHHNLLQPTGTFMSTLYHERDMENKDRGLTDSSGCDPVTDAPPC